jgi:CRISPR-associated protein (TIGR02710 family)
MTTILLITVGGSPQPILTSIQSLQPDRTIFICSSGSRGSISQVTGEGKPCQVRRGAEIVSELPNIPTQLGLGDRFDPATDVVLLDNPDDLAECYQQISAKVIQLKQDTEGQIYADYTGGTKTMSLALGAVAIDYGLTLYLTTSTTRENLIKVERGESTERASTTMVMVERTLNQMLPLFLQQYNYPAAIAQLQSLLQSAELPSDMKRRIKALRDCCAGFDAWDRFDHAQAWRLLEPHMKHIQQWGLCLKKVMHSRARLDNDFEAIASIPGHGYEVVQDLLLNAERRAVQERYDDAVGRLYRALELLVQVRLKQTYGIDTGAVDSQHLPEALRKQYQPRSPAETLQLPLQRSYELVSQLEPDAASLGELYRQRGEAVRDVLRIRNYSLFAHGFQPISKDDYQRVLAVFGGFIQDGIQRAAPKASPPLQFPKQWSIV